MSPEDLDKLVKIPDEDIQSGRHEHASCWGETGRSGCSEKVAWRMTIREWPYDEEHYNTAYWCEKHKPDS